MDGQTDRRIDRLIDIKVDGWKDRQTVVGWMNR